MNLRAFSLVLLLSASPAWGRADPVECAFVPTTDLSDSCLLGSRWQSGASLGLQYGSLNTQALILEVVRGEVSPALMERLNQEIGVELQVQTEDFSLRFRKLLGRVDGNLLIFELPDPEESAFFVSRVNVTAVGDFATLGSTIQNIFGRRAVALISAMRRPERRVAPGNE